VSLLHFLTLYRLRVRTNKRQMFASMFAAMSVQWTVARAVAMGFIKDHLPFVRTDKGGKRKSTEFPAFWEAILAGLLIVGALTLLGANDKGIREINIFAVVLVIQSLPFIAAVLMALLERSSLNDFATWQALEARFSAILSRRPALVKPAPAPAQEHQRELVP